MPSKPFRIPLSGSYTNRVAAANILSSVSGYVGAGIVGIMIVGNTTASTNKDSRFLNCFTMTSGNRRYRVKRAGYEVYITPAAGSIGTAILIWTGHGAGTAVITAFGGTNSTIYNEAVSLGAITGKAKSISETVVSTTPTLTVPSTDNTAWYYDTGVGVMTKITDADFPGNTGLTLAGNFAHMDGFACIMDTLGTLWASDLNSVTAWSANSFKKTNAYPDKGVGCIRHKSLIMAFGSESTEFYHNAGLTPFPFDVIPNMTIKVGAISGDAIAQIADTVFWAGSMPQGGVSIFQYDGGISRISTPDIDSMLALAGASAITLTTKREYGRSFVIVNAASQSFVYCLEEKDDPWHEISSTTPLWYKCAGKSIGDAMVTYAIHNVQTSGSVYMTNPVSLVFTDAGVTYTARMQLPPMDMDTMRPKTWEEIVLVGDTEVSSSPITLSYSDDDYQSYTTFGDLDLSSANPRASRLGMSCRRAWVLTHSANTPMRLEAIEGRATIGSGSSRIR